MGNWPPAIVKSVGWTLLFLLAYMMYELGVPFVSASLGDYLSLACITSMVYLAISFFGWLFIGFPFHWIICKYSEPKFVFYPIASLILGAILFVLGGVGMFFVFGLAAFFQATIFRYYAFRNGTT